MTELLRSKVAGDLKRLETPIPVTSPAQFTLCASQIAVTITGALEEEGHHGHLRAYRKDRVNGEL